MQYFKIKSNTSPYCRLLVFQLKPAPNNGSLDNVKQLLKSTSYDISTTQDNETNLMKSYYFDVVKIAGKEIFNIFL